MSGASFILAINLVVAGLLAAAFAMIALQDQKRSAGMWIALSYVLGMAYFVVEFVIPLLSDARMGVVGAFAVFLAAMAAFNTGVARRYEVAVPWQAMGVLFAASIIGVWFSQELPRLSFGRMMLYQAPYFFMQAIAVGLVLSARSRNWLDTVLAGTLVASALQFLSKPFLAHALGGWGADPQAYLDSNYALVSQTLGTVFAVAVALLMLVVLVRDIVAEATTKFETDTLSGLLNRRGFEHHGALALDHSLQQGLPVAMVIADLDHFKSINDRFGHAAGDRVIRSFAGFLLATASGRHVAGRIGGEEFAIIMPGTNLASARLFAEGARSAFAGLPINGLPQDMRFTASFGVAERAPGERITDLMQRADNALYEAKHAGRDCVRVSPGGAANPTASAKSS